MACLSKGLCQHQQTVHKKNQQTYLPNTAYLSNPSLIGSIHEYNGQFTFRFQESFSIVIRNKSVFPNLSTKHSIGNKIMFLTKKEKLTRLLNLNNDIRTCLSCDVQRQNVLPMD